MMDELGISAEDIVASKKPALVKKKTTGPKKGNKVAPNIKSPLMDRPLSGLVEEERQSYLKIMLIKADHSTIALFKGWKIKAIDLITLEPAGA